MTALVWHPLAWTEGEGVLFRGLSLLAICDTIVSCVVCSKIILEGAEDEVRAALQGLERDVSGLLGGLPLYEPLFQLMCHGVPSLVKAAVHRYAPGAYVHACALRGCAQGCL